MHMADQLAGRCTPKKWHPDVLIDSNRHVRCVGKIIGVDSPEKSNV